NLGDVLNNVKIVIVSGVIPFNLIKGIIISIIFVLLFRRLRHIIK
ncbi:MAG: riboflavin transporter RibU, partial [Staphylococcus epidermidis]|nr:riboflavin transporter RibU [Staphylococcus epidermidis]MDU2270409.1 riboflavin transporter RibU [Staphylococcus epidermidis]MDU6556878.1 riboflavin transporter RibU [Staphylococcus epidermidis]MDU6780418.1 riboflavin transporter RibU [Staphylococcus epidermidis]